MPALTRRRLLAGGAAAAAGAAGAVGVDRLAGPEPTLESWTPGDDEWPARRRGPRRTAAAPEMSPPDAEPALEWERTVSAAGPDRDVPALEAAVVADGTAFVGGRDGVAAFDLSGGGRQWDADAAGEILCYRNGTLFCSGGMGGGTLAALDPDEDGARLWAVDEDNYRVHDFLVADGTVFVGEHGRIAGRDAATGDLEWRFSVGGLGYVHPAVDDGTLYASGPGALATYGPRTGWDAVRRDGPRRVAELSGSFSVPPVVADEAIYAGVVGFPDDHPVLAVERDGSAVRWEGPQYRACSSPAPTDGVGIARTSDPATDYRLVGIDLADGTERWSESREERLSVPVVAGEYAIVGDEGGTVSAVDPASGEPAWETTLDVAVDLVVPAGDRLLVADSSGAVRCLR